MVFKNENKELDQSNNTNLPSGLFNLIMESLAQDVYCGEAGLFPSLTKKKKKKKKRIFSFKKRGEHFRFSNYTRLQLYYYLSVPALTIHLYF